MVSNFAQGFVRLWLLDRLLLGEQHALEYVGVRIEGPIEDLASEPEMQRRFSQIFRMLFVARYMFIFMAVAFLLWKVAEAFWWYDHAIFLDVVEVAMVGVFGPALVWAITKGRNRRRRRPANTMESYSE